MKKLMIIIFCCLSIGSSYANTLAPFTSDGCSLFPDGTFTQPTQWLHCCQAHDFDYWQGGTQSQRTASDRRLQHCINQVAPTGLGFMMFYGVQLGGSPIWPTSFRWGYGWPFARDYAPLGVGEQQQVKHHKAVYCNTNTSIICIDLN